MADVVAEGVVVITADTSAYDASMTKAANKGVKAAKDVGLGWQATAKKLNQNQLISQLETVSSLFIQVGGSVSRVATVATSAIRPLALLGTMAQTAAGAFGATTIAVAGAGAAFAGLAVGGGIAIKVAKGIADAGLEAEAELIKLGHAALIPPESAMALTSYKNAMDALTVATDVAKVELGAFFSETLTRGVTLLLLTKDAVDGLSASFGGMTTVADDFTSTIAEFSKIVVTGGGSILMDLVADGLDRMAENEIKATDATAKHNAELKLEADYQQRLLDAEDERRRKSAEGADDAVAKRKREELATMEKIAAADEARGAQSIADAKRREAQAKQEASEALSYHSKLVSAVEEQHTYEEKLASDRKYWHQEELKAQKLEMQNMANSHVFENWYKELHDSVDRADADIERVTSKLKDTTTQMLEYYGSLAVDFLDKIGTMTVGILGNIQQLNDMAIQSAIDQGNAQVEAGQERADQWADYQLQRIDDSLELEEIGEKSAIKERAQIEATRKQWYENAESRDDNEKKYAKKAFDRSQNLARAAAIVSAAQAAIAMIPGLAYLTYGAPFAAAAIAAAALGTQLAVIDAQSPPEFPGGGMVSPDHHLISAQTGEGVVSRRGMANPDVRDAVERGNRGQAPGGSAIAIHLGRRILTDAVADVDRTRIHVDPRAGKRDPRRGGRG